MFSFLSQYGLAGWLISIALGVHQVWKGARYTQHMYPDMEGPDMCVRGRLGLWQTWLVGGPHSPPPRCAGCKRASDICFLVQLQANFLSTRPRPVTLARGYSYSLCVCKTVSFLTHPWSFHRCARSHTLPLSDTHSNTLTNVCLHSCFFKPLLCKLWRDLGHRVWIFS